MDSYFLFVKFYVPQLYSAFEFGGEGGGEVIGQQYKGNRLSKPQHTQRSHLGSSQRYLIL